jgi:hypothetical protein
MVNSLVLAVLIWMHPYEVLEVQGTVFFFFVVSVINPVLSVLGF